MTRWRVDFKVKSDLVLAKYEKKILFTSPDGTHEIHLLTKRGQGKHAADELYLSAHVILEDNDPAHATEVAETHLRRFLDVLAIVSSSYYSIEERVMVVDWSPNLTMRRLLVYNMFPNPHVPMYALTQVQMDTVRKLMVNPIPRAVRLAMRWWARGLSADSPSEQFQYFWYSLEILAEHVKPATKVASKCHKCSGDLYCPICKEVPLHRPYPKQAIKMLVDKHVTGQPDKFFALIDEARNRLLHGDDPAIIEAELKIEWGRISDSLGKATWVALLSTLMNLVSINMTEAGKLDIIETNTFVHYDVGLTSDISVGATHADPANPQIEEFELPNFNVSINVQEGTMETRAVSGPPPMAGGTSAGGAARG